MSEKACRRCREWKPFSEFCKRSSSKDGYNNSCKDCRAKTNLVWRRANIEENKQKKREYYYQNRDRILRDRNVARNNARYFAKLKQEVYNHYGNRCYCCGLDDPRFLSIEHLNNDGFTQTYRSGRKVSGTTMYKGIIDNDFPADIVLACYNCNCGRAHHDRNGKCPHSEQLPEGFRKETYFLDLVDRRIDEGAYTFPSYVPEDIKVDNDEKWTANSVEKNRRSNASVRQKKRLNLALDELIKPQS